ncbi:MAG: HD domain-containing protein [Roseburia sp.]|nr:HD domain-containing protein [Roseburia sp.]
MKRIPVSDLIPGMITAEDITTYDAKVIVPKGIILTENIIAYLEDYSVYYAAIDDETVADELNRPMLASLSAADSGTPSATEEYNSSNKEKLKNSAPFQRFTHDFNKCAAHFEDMLTKSLTVSEPFYADELLRELEQILHPDGGSISVFDMLLNMHNTEDSVYWHCIDVALISYVLAGWLRFSEADKILAAECGLFHDVGKLMLPSGILRKPGKLTPEEFAIIKTHTTEGFYLLSKYRNIPEAVKNTALMHHEKCDGSGYPYGVTRDEIDKFTKIVTIADVFDAMTSERCYRSAMCPFSVIKFFEDDGLPKYELKYILTFLENVANSYLNHTVTLSNGTEGKVVFINHDDYSRPVIRTDNNGIVNLQEQYYNSIMQLSSQKNVSIETII